MAQRPHPFVIDIKPAWHTPGRYTYSVGRIGKPKSYSAQTFATFSEARLAAQAELNELITAWERDSA
ncbi:hypothetical protein MOX02_36700 [Methylobacterium oxalidis]|uniref:Integrase DNA-binding domain-containing protein n=2 Tax=Methylobacterium oxalidis TaxID=944322 RepID=A0A512J6V9_9HYPH|nr:hypothetical protein MOX02_36700 [Methylobacterium oxalidis]GLS65388.1 hypothetical protein GCM10007888_37700 [Methylobacterium oxalidis]